MMWRALIVLCVNETNNNDNKEEWNSLPSEKKNKFNIPFKEHDAMIKLPDSVLGELEKNESNSFDEVLYIFSKNTHFKNDDNLSLEDQTLKQDLIANNVYEVLMGNNLNQDYTKKEHKKQTILYIYLISMQQLKVKHMESFNTLLISIHTMLLLVTI